MTKLFCEWFAASLFVDLLRLFFFWADQRLAPSALRVAALVLVCAPHLASGSERACAGTDPCAAPQFDASDVEPNPGLARKRHASHHDLLVADVRSQTASRCQCAEAFLGVRDVAVLRSKVCVLSAWTAPSDRPHAWCQLS